MADEVKLDVVALSRKYLGIQETAGSNRGPLVDKWKAAVGRGLTELAIPWCGCFVYAMIAERTGMTKKQIASALGFDAATWYPESTDSWLAQGRAAGLLTKTPQKGDVFLLMRLLKTGYSTNDARHIGFFEAGPVLLGQPFRTVEGNTVPGSGDGSTSREGTSVAARSRIYRPGAFQFLHLPACLSGVA